LIALHPNDIAAQESRTSDTFVAGAFNCAVGRFCNALQFFEQ
jgi:hypothetical protein